MDDLAQDVFLKVHRGIPYFRGEARLSTWIFRIVQNVCVQARGGRQARCLDRAGAGMARRAREFGAVDGDVLGPRRPRSAGQGDGAAAAELSAAGRRRTTCEGVQYEALAEALNLPLGTVKTHLYRAKRRLRELLEE